MIVSLLAPCHPHAGGHEKTPGAEGDIMTARGQSLGSVVVHCIVAEILLSGVVSKTCSRPVPTNVVEATDGEVSEVRKSPRA
jgi:hypothetical protein